MMNRMPVYLYLFAALSSLVPMEVPAGTPLHIRLASTVGTYASRPRSPVSAFLIAPVQLNGAVVLPAGSIFSGEVKSVQRVGIGLVHESAAINLEFNRLTLSNGQVLPVSTRIEQVDNSREQVTRKGLIRGVRTTGSLSYRVCGYMKTALLWEFHARLAFWAIKTLVVQLPEPEIYYPPGVELTLAAAAPIRLPTPIRVLRQEISGATRQPLTEVEGKDLAALVAGMPDQAYSEASSRPSDFINTTFIGSREEMIAAFTAAGWTEARPASFRSRAAGAVALAEGRGFHQAPMSPLLVNNVEAAMSWQKDLNDISKRHHIRVWKQPDSWEGQDVWIGAATRDVDLAYLRPGHALTHRIAENVDEEREKIVDDLTFTSCVERVDRIERPGFPAATRNGTGDLMTSDGDMAVIELNHCGKPRLSTETIGDAPVIAMHGNRWQRFARREILSMRSDLIRANMYWRTYEGVRYGVSAVRRRNRPIEAGALHTARGSSLRAPATSGLFPMNPRNYTPPSRSASAAHAGS